MEQNLNLYYIFVTVARCKNISAAARELYISQPAISKAISKLEQNLGTTLFLRSSKGVKLTQHGELLYRQAENAFQSLIQGEEQLRQELELGVGHLSIGVSASLCKYVLLPYLSRFTAAYPNIQISLSCQSSIETMHALENGTVDIGLVGKTDYMDKWEFYPAGNIQDCLVCSEGYLNNLNERVKKKLITRNNAAEGATLMLLDKDNISRQYVDPFLMAEKSSAAQILEVNSMDLLIDFAKSGLGIACVIEGFVSQELKEGSLKKLPMNMAIPAREIGFVLPKNSQQSDSVRKFFAFCIEKNDVQK